VGCTPQGSDLSSFWRVILNNRKFVSWCLVEKKFTGRAPVDRSSSRDTAVACKCCCDEADAAATELLLRAARVPPQGAADEGRDDETTSSS